MSQTASPSRLRREPPAFRPLTVQAIETLTPRLVRLTIGGDDLDGYEMPAPAGSVRLLLPEPGATDVAIPTWTGNEFLAADGSRPPIRTVTPLHHRPDDNLLDVEVVIHGNTPLATWATTAEPGTPVALSGPARGFDVEPAPARLLLVGDESAVPAIRQLLESVSAPATVIVEAADAAARLSLTDRDDVDVTWLDAVAGAEPGAAMVDAVRAADIGDDTHVWAAGEAAAVQKIRRHLFDDRAIPRSRATVRGYWKTGR